MALLQGSTPPARNATIRGDLASNATKVPPSPWESREVQRGHVFAGLGAHQLSWHATRDCTYLGRAAQAVRGCVSVAQDDHLGVGRIWRLAGYARGLLLLLVVLGGRGDRVPPVIRRVIATLRVGFGSVVGLGGARGAREHRGGRSREA